MITLSTSGNSCGVILIHGDSHYKTPEVFMKDFGNLKLQVDHELFMFTHRTELDIGRDIASYVEKHRLGSVSRISGNNPIHGKDHPICVFVWSRDNRRFWKHHKSLTEEVKDVKPK